MKKFLPVLIFLCVAGISVFAQNLSLSTNGNDLLNGDTVTVAGESSESLIACDNVDVTNKAATALSVKCLRTEISLVPGSTSSFCWGGSCWPEAVSLSPDPTVIASGATALEFSGDLKPNNTYGVSIIRYRFFDMNAIADSICFYAKFVVTLGINDLADMGEVSDAYPNPANNFTTISYKLQSENNTASINVNNLLGEQVAYIPVSDKEGMIKIETSNLPNGIYFYSFTIKDKVVYTKKLILRH